MSNMIPCLTWWANYWFYLAFGNFTYTFVYDKNGYPMFNDEGKILIRRIPISTPQEIKRAKERTPDEEVRAIMKTLEGVEAFEKDMYKYLL